MTRIAEPRQRLWTLNYVIALLGAFTFFGSFFYLLSVLPDYIDEIGGAAWQVGLIVGAFGILPIVVRPLAGRWADRGRRRRMMFVSLVLFTLSWALMVLAEDVWSLFVLRMLQGIPLSMFPTSSGSLVAEIVPLRRRGEGLGFLGVSTSAAQMIFPTVGVLVASQWGFDAIFIVASATSAITIVSVLFLREPVPHPVTTGGEQPVLVPRRAIFPMLIFMTMTFAWSASATFLPLLSKQRDLGNVGLYFLAGGAASMVMRPFAGKISDRVGRVAVIVPGLLVFAVGMWTLAQAQSLAVMLLAGGLSGMGLGIAHTALIALAIDSVAATQRGGATAIFQLAWDIGGLSAGVGLGLVATALNLELVFWLSAALLLVGTGALLWGRKAGWTEPHPESVVERAGAMEIGPEDEPGMADA